MDHKITELRFDVTNDTSPLFNGPDVRRYTVKDNRAPPPMIIMKRTDDVNTRSVESYMNAGDPYVHRLRLLVITPIRTAGLMR